MTAQPRDTVMWLIVKLGRLTTFPHPWRPACRRLLRELIEVAAELSRLRRFADEVVAEAQIAATTTETIARIVRERQMEKH